MGKYVILKRVTQEMRYTRKWKVLIKFGGMSGAAARTGELI